MTNLKKIFCFPIIFLSFFQAGAQKKTASPDITINDLALLSKDSGARIFVKDVIVQGNRKTKTTLVLRELPFKKGDSLAISALNESLEIARQQVYNTTLFNEVNIRVSVLDPKNISVSIDLKERWYLYPVPQFQPVDRNFNDWVKTYHASFDRVNYGLKLLHYNLTGNRDALRVYLINGYTRNISLAYSIPGFNKSRNEGFSLNVGYAQNRRIAYETDPNNKIIEYKKDEFARNVIFAGIGFSKRIGLFKRHFFSVNYTYLTVDDSVISSKYNPNYFKKQASSIGFTDIAYGFRYINVNNVSYSLSGSSLFLLITKRGLGLTSDINMFSVEATLNKYYPLGKKWYAGVQLSGKIKLPFDQAYINQQGLGYYENYLRGLEYYVVDGVATALAKTTLRKKLVDFSIPMPFHIKNIPRIPFAFFAKTYADLGYAYNKKIYPSNLNNRLLYTAGIGLDILTLYDINLRFEYSFNQLHENGLFLHTQGGF
jgi:outer membrane protein assembly factor BamA